MIFRPLGVTLAILFAANAAFAQPACDTLANAVIGTATITASTLVPEGPYVPPARPGAPAAQAAAPQPTLPAHCDVRGVIRPTSDSEIKFAMWMPVAGWNGKYRQEGNGGWAGNIPFQAMVDALRRGYVTAGTDDGHEGAGADWAIGHPEKLIDFGHRAVHEVNVHSKLIIQKLYGSGPSRSYFMGCSDGGREGLMEAQRYPTDFDGMVLGAPANRWSGLFTAFVWNELAQLKTPDSKIPVAKLPAIQNAVIAACDKKDGVEDGLLEDPRTCRFDPAVLTCKGADSPQCLTAPQVEALKQIYGGPKNPRTGEQLYPGFYPGERSQASERPSRPASGGNGMAEEV